METLRLTLSLTKGEAECAKIFSILLDHFSFGFNQLKWSIFLISRKYLVANRIASIVVDNATPSGQILLLFSGTGAGPLPTIFGHILVSPPLYWLPMAADPSGRATLPVPVPRGTAGITLWFHSIDAGSTLLSNGLTAVIG